MNCRFRIADFGLKRKKHGDSPVAGRPLSCPPSTIRNRQSAIRNPPVFGRRNGGFTLLECLTALVILSIGLVSIFAVFIAGAASHKRGVDQTTAGMAAQKILAELSTDFTDERIGKLAGGQSTKRRIALANQVDPDFPAYKYDLTLEAFDNRREAYAVTLRIKWQEGGVEQAAAFETVMLRKLGR